MSADFDKVEEAAARERELDVFACPLDGVSQIEASAGTGKTWNICALYVRLLLEKDLNADQILVVTFTKAATAELHERIRTRLADLEQALQHGDPGGDAFIERLFETTLGDDAGALPHDLALKRIRRALRGFDQAAIHTIHAFCQRALQEAPFAAAMPFRLETEADDSALRFDVAAQFWRERVEATAARDTGFASWLVQMKAGPASLDILLAQRLKKPLCEVIWEGVDDETADRAEGVADLARHFDDSHALWRDEREAIARLLEVSGSQLKQTSHKPEQIAGALAAWDRYFQNGDHQAQPAREAARLSASALQGATKAKSATPEHPFFACAEALLLAGEAARQRHVARWLGLVRDWLNTAPAHLRERKRAARVVSFDDLLANLHGALLAHPWLAETLRARYPAALIDEFQDTDPLQFEIFNRIFAEAGASGGPRGPLFLVGDPKQAIYSFRAADLHTYLRARRHADARYTLAVNQRSTAAIIDACNLVFEQNPRAFVLDDLDYHRVRASERSRAPFVDRHDGGRADFRVWLLPDAQGTQDRPMQKRDAERAAAQAAAAEIARLLRDAAGGAVRIGADALKPADIAVLVQTHRQGSTMKRVLAASGVGSVELAQASVFESVDAEQIERVLLAIDTPGDMRRLRAALASDWIGLDAAALWRLERDNASRAGHAAEFVDANTASYAQGVAPGQEEDAASWVERFTRYRALWHERGFAVMWRTLSRELRIAQRIIGAAEGERRLTNLNHLAELIQARAAEQPGIAPTLRWLAARRAEGGGGEEAQLRLESDRNLVRIVTVHKSKGLEYAVVFCPFLADGGARRRADSANGLPAPHAYHDDAGAAVLHFGADDERAEQAAHAMQREQAAERARLVYVALTRAVYRCYLVAGIYGTGAHASVKEAQQSVLNWLVAGDGMSFDAWLAKPPDAPDIIASWRALDGEAISVDALPAIERRVPLAPDHASADTPRSRVALRAIRETWRIASFSSLVAHGDREAAGEAAGVLDARPDHDALAGSMAIDASGFDGAHDGATLTSGMPQVSQPLADDDILRFPRGPSAGECLHRMFELADFTRPSTWPAAIEAALDQRPPNAAGFTRDALKSMMARLLADVVAVPLGCDLTLAAIGPAKRLTELEFVFPVNAIDLSALRRTLVAHGYPDVPLDAHRLDGYLKGFIDAVVEFAGRFWIVDWKSNHLGDTRRHYAPEALPAAMATHAYHLQALIYTVALHRYLRTRLPGYDYETHTGASLYLFVRGVRPAWPGAGVHTVRASRALVDDLDRLFGGSAS